MMNSYKIFSRMGLLVY